MGGGVTAYGYPVLLLLQIHTLEKREEAKQKKKPHKKEKGVAQESSVLIWSTYFWSIEGVLIWKLQYFKNLYIRSCKSKGAYRSDMSSSNFFLWEENILISSLKLIKWHLEMKYILSQTLRVGCIIFITKGMILKNIKSIFECNLMLIYSEENSANSHCLSLLGTPFQWNEGNKHPLPSLEWSSPLELQYHIYGYFCSHPFKDGWFLCNPRCYGERTGTSETWIRVHAEERSGLR